MESQRACGTVDIARCARRIAGVVLADSIACGTAEGYSKDWEIGGEKVTLAVVRSSEA